MGMLGLTPATGLLGDCPCCNQVAKADDLWGYGQNWEGVCATGQYQSPIDIPIRNSKFPFPHLVTYPFLFVKCRISGGSLGT
jgi:hypothetical protein